MGCSLYRFQSAKDMNFVVLTILLALTLVGRSFGAPVDDQEPHLNGENGWYVPLADGNFEWISAKDTFTLAQTNRTSLERARKPSVVEYYLHTRANAEEPQLIEPRLESVQLSHFNKDHPTRFVVHGWRGSYQAELNAYVRDAWLSADEYNIIVVDWRSRSLAYNYYTSASYVPEIGKIVANMIDFLHSECGMSFETLTLIGHSLGAHVVGFAGKSVQKGRVHTIIGLDAALPLFDYEKPAQRLAHTDAEYVESIHTNGGKLGFLKPIGRSAFYPNGGRVQPGCGLDITGSCAHARSYMYYAEAVRRNSFPSMKCADYTKAAQKKCGAVYSSVHMACLTNPHTATGNFYVPVNTEAPYGKGV